jgi:hypothetical protein
LVGAVLVVVGGRSNHNPLDLIQGHFVIRPVVELRGSRRLMCADPLRMLKRSPTREVCCNARYAEGLAADVLRTPSFGRPPLDYRQHFVVMEATIGEPAAPVDAPEDGRALLPGDGGWGKVRVEVFFARVPLAACFLLVMRIP